MRQIRTKKSFIAFVTLFIMLVLSMSICTLNIHAENAPTYTYTVSEDGKWSRTQDAYLTGGILFRDIGLKKPEDIFIKGNMVYVADTGNGRIAVMDKQTNNVTFIGSGVLSEPTGIFVNDEGNIFVADYKLAKGAMFSADGQLVRWYERPNSPIYGKTTNFNPKKVVSDKRGNIYIVSEGSYDGIVQLSKEGEFLGYFGTNRTRLSPIEAIQNLIFTEEQKAKLFNKIPKTFYNISIDNKGMVYSITQGIKNGALKKHNISGTNILNPNLEIKDEENFVDLCVGTFGQIYTLTETGLIYEYDSTGNIVYSFGGRAISTEKNGVFSVASGIASDEYNNIYVLDKERGIVQMFFPTIFAEITHNALSLFENGKYTESNELWNQILRLSGTSRIAHNGLGKAFFQANDYEKAAYHFKVALNRVDYSESFWEIRNSWLEQNTANLIMWLIVLLIIWNLLKLLDRKKGIFNPFRKVKKFFMDIKLFSDIFYIKRFIKHPIDSMYEVRRDRRGTVLSATIIYFIAFVIFTANFVGRGFIFNTTDLNNTSYFYVVILFFMPILLWVAGNYMVSSINDGEGRFRDVYCATAYAFAPFIMYMPIIIISTYVLTINEAFILFFSETLIWVWTGIVLFLGLKEIHNYEVKETFKNVFLTIFLMFIAVILFAIVYMLWDQLVEFVYSVVKEVIYNVWSK